VINKPKAPTHRRRFHARDVLPGTKYPAIFPGLSRAFLPIPDDVNPGAGLQQYPQELCSDSAIYAVQAIVLRREAGRDWFHNA